MGVNDVGVAGQPATNLTAWQRAVRDALNSSDTTVDARIAAAVAERPKMATGSTTIATDSFGVTPPLPVPAGYTLVAATYAADVARFCVVRNATQVGVFNHDGTRAASVTVTVAWIAKGP